MNRSVVHPLLQLHVPVLFALMAERRQHQNEVPRPLPAAQEAQRRPNNRGRPRLRVVVQGPPNVRPGANGRFRRSLTDHQGHRHHLPAAELARRLQSRHRGRSLYRNRPHLLLLIHPHRRLRAVDLEGAKPVHPAQRDRGDVNDLSGQRPCQLLEVSYSLQ